MNVRHDSQMPSQDRQLRNVRDLVNANNQILGNADTGKSYISVNSSGDLIIESDTEGDYWCNASGVISENTDYIVWSNRISGTVYTYLSTDGGDFMLIDTKTPADDISLSNISNSLDNVRMNGRIKSFALIPNALTDSQINLLTTLMKIF